MLDIDPVRVFISSKQAEFANERMALARALEPLPLLAPIWAEDWPPERKDIHDKYVDDVRRSTVFVGLYGCVYSEPTEKEYRAALENPHREILVFIRECAGVRRDVELRRFISELQEHVVARLEDPDVFVKRCVDGIWRAVGNIVKAYRLLAEPYPMAMGGGESPLRRKVANERKNAEEKLSSLGFPQWHSEKARQAAAELEAMMRRSGG